MNAIARFLHYSNKKARHLTGLFLCVLLRLIQQPYVSYQQAWPWLRHRRWLCDVHQQ